MNLVKRLYSRYSWPLILLLASFCLIISIFGIHALRVAPTIVYDGEIVTIRNGIEIRKFNEITLDHHDLWKFPAFIWPADEKQWWDKQKTINHSLVQNEDIQIEFTSDSPASWQITAQLVQLSYFEVIKRVGLIHIVCLIYIYSAITVYRRHNTAAGFVCAFFLMSSALYLLAIAPVVHRPIFLDVSHLHFFINTFFVSSTFQISILHFAMLFLRKRFFIYKHYIILIIFYGYSIIISIMYLTGLIALATTIPFLFIWIILLGIIFLHSMIKEKDPIIKKQILTCFLAPLLVAVFFVVAILLPWQPDGTLIDYYALFSLMIPFALSLSLDNQHLYKDRLKSERESKNEKERIHRELHDTVLNDLASMAILIEGAERFIDIDNEKVKERLTLLKDKTLDSSTQLRSLLWIIDTRKDNWQDVIGLLRKTGYELFSHSDIEYEFETTGNELECPPPSPKTRHTIYQIYREALINVNKHAKATKVAATLDFGSNSVTLIVKDNGIGFDPDDVNSESYGLDNIKRRVTERGGELTIKSKAGEESQIIVKLPLDNTGHST